MVLVGLLAAPPLPAESAEVLKAFADAASQAVGETAAGGFESLTQKRQYDAVQAELDREEKLPPSRNQVKAEFDEVKAEGKVARKATLR
ncbi:hypothetical protein CTAYLR_007397 [Chrysophaeum taylorii]|uniref:Uncharacterized protein n=1 Tax=Chrysophaeum taylorii TaxID=2483200 RepID=A0AAD7U5I5_9STRA|nr:hypothetical protein CTAYLR_007397 [Chrysophaeum taylorii]